MKKLAALFTILLFVGACSSDKGEPSKKEENKEAVKTVEGAVKDEGIKKPQDPAVVDHKEAVQSNVPGEAKSSELKKPDEAPIVNPNGAIGSVPHGADTGQVAPGADAGHVAPGADAGQVAPAQEPNHEVQKALQPGSNVAPAEGALKQP